MSILIIGSGLSALAIHRALIDAGLSPYQIHLIDTNLRHVNKKDFKKLSSAKKTLFNSDHMYEEIASTAGSSHSLSLSNAAGGLSTVWGAGIRLWDEDLIKLITEKTEEFYRSSLKILDILPYFGDRRTLNFPDFISVASINAPYKINAFSKLINSKIDSVVKIFETPLAVNTFGIKACAGCGLCLTGCPYSSIFNASDYFDDLLLEKKIKRINGEVITLKQMNESVEVAYRTRDNANLTKIFNHVYLCAGAIATPKILLQSKLVKGKIEVKDSQVFYFIGMYRRPTKIPSENFSLSQATVTDSKIFSASLYECNIDVRNRLSKALSEKFFQIPIRLPKFLDKFIFLGIGFIDSDLSGRIEIEIDQNNNVNLDIKNNQKTAAAIGQAVSSIAKVLRKQNLWVLPKLTLIPPVGTRFHSGAGLPINSDFINNDGSVRTARNIHLGDTSILPKLFAGSHTFNSMAFNYSTVVEKIK
jgi:ferredoxin